MKLCFDSRHLKGMVDVSDDKEGFAAFVSELKHEGYEFIILDQDLQDGMSKMAARDVLWIPYPSQSLDRVEIEEIKNMLERGGGLLLSGEWGNIGGSADNLNALLTGIGSKIRFNHDRITDHVHAITQRTEIMGTVVDEKKVPQFLVVKEFAPHVITHGLNAIGYYAGSSLSAPDKQVVAWSSPTSFSDLDANRTMDADEEFGSFNIAAFDIVSRGRIFAIGDTSIFSNQYIHQYDNMEFCKNVVKWLSRGL